jgi:hypothetical protein
MIKKVCDTKPEGTRKVGKPRSRWEERVWQDTRILGVRNWRNVASNREEWRAILRKARAHTGLMEMLLLLMMIMKMMTMTIYWNR